jgi:lipoate-protein ligase B
MESERDGSELWVEWLGLVPYREALELQAKRVEALRAGSGPECLLLLEHPAVLTLGRSGDASHVREPGAALEAAGIELHRVSRGGDVTYHGPGQLVGYLILDLSRRGEPDVGRFLRAIEAALIEALGQLGLSAHTRAGMTGVFAGSLLGEPWLGEPWLAEQPLGEPWPFAASPAETPRKIASIGIGLRGWVTWHGFALNVTTDLAAFRAIVPCGLHDVAMTSLAAELGAKAPADLDACAREAVGAAFSRRFGACGA